MQEEHARTRILASDCTARPHNVGMLIKARIKLYRGSLSIHVCSCFIEFIKRVGESDKMRCLPSILSLLRDEFNKLNSTGARMIDSIYQMHLKLLKIAFLA